MLGCVETLFIWGPPTYHLFGVAGSLFGASIVKKGPTISAKERFPEIYQKVTTLRNDILIYKIPDTQGHAIALGGGKVSPSAVILYNQGLEDLCPEALPWIMKHELAHLQHNDHFINQSLGCVASSVSTFAVPVIHSCLPWWLAPVAYCIPYQAGSIASNTALRALEMIADDFANKHSTDQELIEGAYYLEATIEFNKKMHVKNHQFLTSEGNNVVMFNLSHPPYTQRLEVAKSELRRRKVTFTPANQEKRERIEKYFMGIAKIAKLKTD